MNLYGEEKLTKAQLQSDDDPRAFLSGENAEDNGRETRRQFFLPEGGGSTQFFSISQGNRGEMGDDIFQYFGPNRPTEENNNTETEPNVNTMMQSILANLMNQTHHEEQENTNSTGTTEGNENNNGSRPLLFYGNMVNGNFRLQPVNQEQQQQEDDNEQGQTNNTNDTRGNVAK